MNLATQTLETRPTVARPSPVDLRSRAADFPALRQKPYGKRLAYLDNAATTQKPQGVIDAVSSYYEKDCANVHRGAHYLSERASELFEAARDTIQRFINAGSREEIVFVRGTTEAINLVARSYAGMTLKPGDEILITAMEHHSNIVPWQLACEATGAVLRVVPITDQGDLELQELDGLLGPKTRLVAITHVSNVLGTINPIKSIVKVAHERGVPVLVDGAQAAAHLPVDVQDLDCDFYVFSGHKMYGPTGIGVLFGRAELLDRMPPYQGGGLMIRTVTFEKTTYAALPQKFEAGTPDIAGAIGLGAAVCYLDRLGMDAVTGHESRLLSAAQSALVAIPGVRICGTSKQKTGIVSFVVDGIHAHDLATIADREGVAIRAGHHCAQPLMARLGVSATARASFGLYNSVDDVDALVHAVHAAQKVFRQ